MSVSGVLTSHTTQDNIQRLAEEGTQSILLVGKKGTGTDIIAKQLAELMLGLSSQDELNKYPYFYHLAVEDGKKDIPIAEIRRVVAATALKIPSTRVGIKRVVLIQNAENMSLEAQNALLSDLEEPSPSTCYILTQDSGKRLLPTVISRCQKVVIQNPKRSEILQHYTPGYEDNDVLSAWALAGGAPQLVDELLRNTEHPLKLAATMAKEFIAANTYHRLLIASKLAENKQNIQYFLDALDRIVDHLLKSAVVSGDKKMVHSIGSMGQTVGETRRMLEVSTNTKLCLLWLTTNY